MKICIVTPNIIKGDGQGRVNYEIAWEAIRRGHQVTLLASRVAPELQESSQVNWISIPVKGWPIQLLREIVFAWRSAAWLRQHRSELDIVQGNGAVTWTQVDVDIAPFVHSAWLRSPVHTWQIRRDLYGLYQWFYTVLNAYWEKNAFRQAKVSVAVSQRVKRELLDIGVPDERIRVILCGIDLQEFSPSSVDRKKLGLPEQVPLALFVGDIRTNRKNLDTVLHALVQVPNLHLVVVGTAGTTKISPYPVLAAQLGLNERVHFRENEHPVSEVMRAVDLFVFPSRYEPFGLVVIEAMASGLPIVTAATTGAAELVTPECGVVLSDSEDTNTLAEALSTLVKQPDLRSRMGKAAHTIAQQHSWASMAQTYVDLFEELASHEHHRSHTHLSPTQRPGTLPGGVTKANSTSG
jgi:glycosyltransferase involved in cell wall biosynthesis